MVNKLPILILLLMEELLKIILKDDKDKLVEKYKFLCTEPSNIAWTAFEKEIENV